MFWIKLDHGLYRANKFQLCKSYITSCAVHTGMFHCSYTIKGKNKLTEWLQLKNDCPTKSAQADKHEGQFDFLKRILSNTEIAI